MHFFFLILYPQIILCAQVISIACVYKINTLFLQDFFKKKGIFKLESENSAVRSDDYEMNRQHTHFILRTSHPNSCVCSSEQAMLYKAVRSGCVKKEGLRSDLSAVCSSPRERESLSRKNSILKINNSPLNLTQ